MTHQTLVQRAARSNAAWCEAVCAAHGMPGEFFEDLWVNPQAVPANYPNAVTLRGEPTAMAQTDRIADLVARAGSQPVAVKDSFAALDLAPLGFRVLFAAEWIALPPDPAPMPIIRRWRPVVTTDALLQWQAAQAGRGAAEPLLREAQLRRGDVAVLAAVEAGEPVAGAILHRSAGVVGISNVFANDVPLEAIWRDLAAIAWRDHAGKTIVGYEQGAALDAALAAGFRPIGPLRIWIRDPG